MSRKITLHRITRISHLSACCYLQDQEASKDLTDQIESVRDNISYIQDNINECQSNIMQMEEGKVSPWDCMDNWTNLNPTRISFIYFLINL